MLKTYRYADSVQLAFALKASANDVTEIIENHIIDYLKANEEISVKDFCRKFYIKVDYVEKLVQEGRLECSEDLSEIKAEAGAVQQQNKQAFEQLKRRATLMELKEVSNTIHHSNETPVAQPKTQGFFTRDGKRR